MKRFECAAKGCLHPGVMVCTECGAVTCKNHGYYCWTDIVGKSVEVWICEYCVVGEFNIVRPVKESEQ
jgi:hypothetical protein